MRYAGKSGAAFLAVAVMALQISCGGGGAGNPEDAITGLFDALKNADGERAVGYLSSDVISEFSEGLEELQASPVMASEQLATIGVDIAADELAGMTPRDFAAAMMSSDMIGGMLGSAEVVVGEASVDGDRATVEVTVRFMGEETVEDVPLILQGGSWKVDGEFGFNF